MGLAWLQLLEDFISEGVVAVVAEVVVVVEVKVGEGERAVEGGVMMQMRLRLWLRLW